MLYRGGLKQNNVDHVTYGSLILLSAFILNHVS